MNFIQPKNREQVEMMSTVLLIAPDNEVRVLDAFVDALNMNKLGFQQTLADEGRPPFHPKTFLSLYIYGYMNRVRSSRRLHTHPKFFLPARCLKNCFAIIISNRLEKLLKENF